MFFGRALFYVLVIATTMPGAFLWCNQRFQKYVRVSGLAEMPQIGVLHRTDYHHEQLKRAKREVKKDLAKIKERGIKARLRLLKPNVQQQLQESFSHA